MALVLGIIGSPRQRGNTAVLVEAALAAAREAGAETRALMLSDYRIGECIGCHACWRPGDCVLRDDMLKIYELLAAADAVILGTPVYWFGPTALMKGFFDRMVYFNCEQHRRLISGMRAGVVVPYAATDISMAAPVVEFFDRCLRYLEVRLVGEVTAPGVTRPGEVARHHDIMRAARDLGAALALGQDEC